MGNPFFLMTEKSVERPKTALAIILIALIALSSGVVHLKTDNSEDGFFPDNETVTLLNEIEEEYQASVDFVRIIDEIQQGDLYEVETWNQLAMIESELIQDENFAPYHYPLFGIQANTGMASNAIQWQLLQDPVFNKILLDDLIGTIEQVRNASSENLTHELTNLTNSADQLPSFEPITAEQLGNWNFTAPQEWISRIDSGANISVKLEEILWRINSLAGFNSGRESAEIELIFATTGPIIGHVNMLLGLQDIDFKQPMMQSIPVNDRTDPWNMSGPVITTLVVSNDPVAYGYDETKSDTVQNLINDWSEELLVILKTSTGDDELRTFSFAQFGVGSTATLGKEIGMLTGSAFMLLTVILWFNFRSKRETAYVMTLTLFAVAATYGLSGWLQYAGVNMVFNAAMNSIPVLLLAIGVDYGLHVVLRIREELKNSQEASQGTQNMTMRDFSVEARKLAIRRGTIFTSIALLIAIFTDVVGFLSFRFSALNFLQVFGTVIAIGLFFIYLLSITALPALMSLIPPKRLPIDKASKIEVGKISEGLGKLSTKPTQVAIIALILLIPMYVGFQQLEVGFEQRDQFDDSIPVVADFIMLSDDFQSSRSPLYIVYDGDVISAEGWESWNMTYQAILSSPDNSGVPNGLWDLLEDSRQRYEHLDLLMADLDSQDLQSWDNLSSWLLSNETGRNLSSSLLHSNGQQTLISFQANTLDWQATVDLTQRIEDLLAQTEESFPQEGELRVSGRSLINAQTTSEVAASSIQSTAIVAIVILIMLIAIHTTRQKDITQGFARGFISWIPLMMVVCWVYGIMGFTGYDINPQTVTIGALSLGLGVDYAVHFTVRLEEEVEHNPRASQEVWVANASATTGRAMFGAALTTAGGFAVLNLSALLPLRLFGQAFVVAITLALLSSLILLPAFYTKFLKEDAKKYLEEEE